MKDMSNLLNTIAFLDITTSKRYSAYTRVFLRTLGKLDETAIVSALRNPENALEQAQKQMEVTRAYHAEQGRALRMVGVGIGGYSRWYTDWRHWWISSTSGGCRGNYGFRVAWFRWIPRRSARQRFSRVIRGVWCSIRNLRSAIYGKHGRTAHERGPRFSAGSRWRRKWIRDSGD